MSENVSFEIMRCPSCGGKLNITDAHTAIECVYCGNTVHPVVADNNKNDGNKGSVSNYASVKIEGIKSSSSALAYMDEYFEDYDWTAFSYSRNLTIPEIDKLAAELKTTSADDKKTWIVCFRALCVPFIKKAEGCKDILLAVIEDYKNDNLDAYSKFDAYKGIVSVISVSKESVIERLKALVQKAQKYGADSTEINEMNNAVSEAVQKSNFPTYSSVDSIPEIAKSIADKNRVIASSLAAKGIDAEAELKRAKELIDNNKDLEALDILLKLEGYADSEELMEYVDRYYLLDNVLEIGNFLYYFRKIEGGATYDLFPEDNGKLASAPIACGIKKIITNYASILYYLNDSNVLVKTNLITGETQKTPKLSFKDDMAYTSGRSRKVYLAGNAEGYYGDSSVYELTPSTGEVKCIIEKPEKIIGFESDRFIFVSKKENEKILSVYDTVSAQTVELGGERVTVQAHTDDSVIYTVNNPDKNNMDLYIRRIDGTPEVLIDRNIFAYCDKADGRIFYYVGNRDDKSLITKKLDGTDRKPWPLFISKILFTQGGWMYYLRTSGYNSILCRSRTDGSKCTVIASDIKEFICLKNGYLYYLNYASSLIKVRMDGTNFAELCENVEKVLTIKEDKIVFISVDMTEAQTLSQTVKKTKSIYAIDFSKTGKTKIAYDIKDAKEYDDNMVYYIFPEKREKSSEEAELIDCLYDADINTYETEKLLELKSVPVESSGNGFTVAMVIMVALLFIMIIGFACEAPGVGTVGLIGAVISLIIGLGIKAAEKNK